jgi:hypothetical protein
MRGLVEEVKVLFDRLGREERIAAFFGKYPRFFELISESRKAVDIRGVREGGGVSLRAVPSAAFLEFHEALKHYVEEVECSG